jgi:hypothetical protein
MTPGFMRGLPGEGSLLPRQFGRRKKGGGVDQGVNLDDCLDTRTSPQGDWGEDRIRWMMMMGIRGKGLGVVMRRASGMEATFVVATH